MPYILTWESESSIWCQFYGSVDFDDVNDATNEFYNDYRSDFVTDALWDFSQATEVVISTMEASVMAATDFAASTYMKPLKSAFVTSNPALSQLVNVYIRDMDKLGSPWTNQLFQTVGEAKNWMKKNVQNSSPTVPNA